MFNDKRIKELEERIEKLERESKGSAKPARGQRKPLDPFLENWRMNKDEILDMPAGKKMNQLIWWKIFDMTPIPPNNNMDLLPDYSGEMSPAWSVAERINKMIFDGDLKLGSDYNYLTLECVGYTTGYAASFDRLLDHEWYEDITNYDYAAHGETAPLAICRAALLARGLTPREPDKN